MAFIAKGCAWVRDHMSCTGKHHQEEDTILISDMPIQSFQEAHIDKRVQDQCLQVLASKKDAIEVLPPSDLQ